MKDYAEQADKHCVFCECNIMLIRKALDWRRRLSHAIPGTLPVEENGASRSVYRAVAQSSNEEQVKQSKSRGLKD